MGAKNNFHCYRIIVKYHGTKMGKHHFAFLKDVKEDGISDLLKEITYYLFYEKPDVTINFFIKTIHKETKLNIYNKNKAKLI